MDETLRRPGTFAKSNLEPSMYLHRSCLPLVQMDIGQENVTGGVAHGECEGMCGL